MTADRRTVKLPVNWERGSPRVAVMTEPMALAPVWRRCGHGLRHYVGGRDVFRLTPGGGGCYRFAHGGGGNHPCWEGELASEAVFTETGETAP